ncbi:hypothetical protein [Bifidobacterium mongoliense]|uniref:Uncharacterized protein n=1 Tax=Bifidobacterium mongoliense DSM 21395 TaxID=1437603 RepID=A0A087CAF6_9BIFI|nr:hypothetical protein [Bifidobacterium mongoliense]KFI80256.1 hypothetical protein BMON_0128 [Bifidobacterium mongoliense DSM 21395]
MSLVRIYTTSDISPTVSLYGGAGDYEMILRYLDGWYSTPDAKVKLTERASGDGAHDVSAEDIIYGTRTIVVDYRILTDSRTRLLAHEGSLLSLAHQQVRFRVTDDDSDLFASGYVDSAVKDKSQQNLARQTETGTLTIICPRPERLAWSPLQSQLFPVSAVQGGLRYSTVHRLVSAWTGAANASTSTLSQGGTVVATNLVTSPKPLAAGWAQSAVTMTDTPDGLAVSAQNDNADEYAGNAKIPCNPDTTYHIVADLVRSDGPTNSNGPLFAYESDAHDRILATHMRIGGSGRGVLQADFTTTPTTSSISIRLYAPLDVTQQTVWRHIGLYTAADWNAMQSLGIDWFDGDSYPVPTGKGLSYPLNYGTGGVASNVALLLNQGSSKAFPVLTVTGPFPNGVQVQWGGNALQYDGAIGAVPLILDSRSQTASMGGVDVSRNLSRRDFPVVPANGSVSLRLMSAGTGWVTAVCRDTYI